MRFNDDFVRIRTVLCLCMIGNNYLRYYRCDMLIKTILLVCGSVVSPVIVVTAGI